MSAGMMCPFLGSMFSKSTREIERLQKLSESWRKSFMMRNQTRQILIAHLKSTFRKDLITVHKYCTGKKITGKKGCIILQKKDCKDLELNSKQN